MLFAESKEQFTLGGAKFLLELEPSFFGGSQLFGESSHFMMQPERLGGIGRLH